MNTSTVFIQKSKETYKWVYLVDSVRHEIMSSGTMMEQLVDVITNIRDAHNLHDVKVTVFSTSFLRILHSDLVLTFPHMNLIPVVDPDLTRAFNKVMKKSMVVSKKKNRVLFVCSDASKSPKINVCGWAWYSSDTTGATNYNFGVGYEHSTVTAEFEGIMHAIIDNADKDYTTIHVYCDSKFSVESAQFMMTKKKPIPSFAYGNKRLLKLIDEAWEVGQRKNIRIEWVRGHKSHRLNLGADYLSRKARLASEQNMKLAKDDLEVAAVMSMFV